jgi:hypothetical protein
MARPSVLCILGMILAFVLPVGALSLMAGVASEWVQGAPMSRVTDFAREYEAPEIGEDVTRATSEVMGAWPKYYLVFGVVSCMIGAAVGAALCRHMHPGWFALVFVPLLVVSPPPSAAWGAAWAAAWAAAGFVGAAIVHWLRSRAQITPV